MLAQGRAIGQSGAVTDAQLVTAEVDWGHIIGYFVRLDVELPRDALYAAEGVDGGGPQGWLALTPDEADALADHLRERAEQARKAGA